MALRLDRRSELSLSPSAPVLWLIPAARRLTAPRECTSAITPHAVAAVAINTISASTLSDPSPNRSNNMPQRATIAQILGSDPEVHHAVHDEVATRHPAA